MGNRLEVDNRLKMDNRLKFAADRLLLPTGLTLDRVQQLLQTPLAAGADFADIYFQYAESESWVLEEGIIKDGSFSSSMGTGIRAMQGAQTGFSFCDGAEPGPLENAVKAACAVLRQSGSRVVAPALRRPVNTPLYAMNNPLASLSVDDKLKLLRLADTTARNADPAVTEVSVSLVGSWSVMLVAATDTTLAADVRPLVRFNVSVILADGKKRERGTCGAGARKGYESLTPEDVRHIAQEAVRQARVNLSAKASPAGEMPVVLGSGWPGILLHEAVGHGLEGDFNRKGTSTFAGKVGQRVTSPLCSVVDNGTLAGLRGSLNVDDEGTPTQETLLIENGILQGYLQDKLNSRLMGVSVTGNGRRESYAHLPMPRMTNTYMKAGEESPQDIIRSVKKGIYCANFGGGQVDITSGNFVFSASEAYLIEDGKVTTPVKGATLIGNGPDIMKRISRVGNDLALDRGVGTCGKEGQSVPVGVGQPTLKIDAITVGGTAAS